MGESSEENLICDVNTRLNYAKRHLAKPDKHFGNKLCGHFLVTIAGGMFGEIKEKHCYQREHLAHSDEGYQKKCLASVP